MTKQKPSCMKQRAKNGWKQAVGSMISNTSDGRGSTLATKRHVDGTETPTRGISPLKTWRRSTERPAQRQHGPHPDESNGLRSLGAFAQCAKEPDHSEAKGSHRKCGSNSCQSCTVQRQTCAEYRHICGLDAPGNSSIWLRFVAHRGTNSSQSK